MLTCSSLSAVPLRRRPQARHLRRAGEDAVLWVRSSLRGLSSSSSRETQAPLTIFVFVKSGAASNGSSAASGMSYERLVCGLVFFIAFVQTSRGHQGPERASNDFRV